MRSGAEPAPFGFTGELQSDDLVYLRARWYDPASGTFLGRDPFEGFARLPYSLHPYQYAYAAPTMWTDPSGRCLDAQGNPCLQPGASPDPAWEPFEPQPVVPTPAVPYSPDGYWVAPPPATPTPYPLTGYRDPVDSATMLDGLQTTLDVAGLAPVFGIFPDGINACISLLRGDDTGFVLSAGAMIPVIGMAGTAAKYSDEAAAIARYGGDDILGYTDDVPFFGRDVHFARRSGGGGGGGGPGSRVRLRATFVGKSGEQVFGKLILPGRLLNRTLLNSGFTTNQLLKAFRNTPYSLYEHAAQRLIDRRTTELGYKTMNDIALLINKGTIELASDHPTRVMIVGSGRRMAAIIDVETMQIVTFLPNP